MDNIFYFKVFNENSVDVPLYYILENIRIQLNIYILVHI